MTVEPAEAMVAKARRSIELWAGGDYDEAVALLAEDVVLQPTGTQSPIHGRAAVRAYMEPETLAPLTFEPLDFETAGDKVLVHGRGRTRGIRSGIELEWDGWAVFTIGPHGLHTRIQFFRGHDGAAARAAAGLSAGSASEPAAPG